jgi:hypothetical protein
LNLVAPFVAGVVGAAVGYGGIVARVRMSEKRIDKLDSRVDVIVGNPSGRSMFVPRGECEAFADERAAMEKKLNALMRFARHALTVDKKMSLTQANDLLGEG